MQYETKVFKNGPSTNLWNTAFKKFEVIWSVNGCIRQISLGSFLNTLFHMGQGIQEWTK